MDLSVNNISKKNILNFKGVKGDFDKKNVQVIKFYPPAYDKVNETARVELAPLKVDNSNGAIIPPKKSDFIYTAEFKNGEPFEVPQSFAEKMLGNLFAYRYVITGENEDGTEKTRYIIDSFRKMQTKDKQWVNVLDLGRNFGITPKAGPMRHSFIDSDVLLKKQGGQEVMRKYDPDFVRNHFNKLGGSIEGLKYLLTKTNELSPYRYIMSTPDIGVDKISSHKYWPNNQYQCNNLEEFKDFNFELFKRGKGYVADGAFTSQGLQSPLVQHVLKWGKESPFYNMLKIDEYPVLGILPDRSVMEDTDDLDYIGVKIVNNPNFSRTYNPNKATYIQFYDTRLVQDKTLAKDEIIKQYDKNPEDHYDITTHQNSITPYYFEISRNDVSKLEKFRTSNHIMLKEVEDVDDFLSFKNFKIDKKSAASGANFWDGNRDIIKMNLSNPINTSQNKEGFIAARDYLFGVATYWSELVQSDLILKTALSTESEKAEYAKANGIDDFNEIKNSLNALKYPVLEQNKQADDYIREFPLQSIETDPDLSAIFSEPEFKESFLNKFFNDISPIINNAIERVIPQNYKGNSEYKTYVTKLYANTLIRNLLIGAMCPLAVKLKNGNDGFKKEERLETDFSKLREVSLHSLGADKALTVEREREIVENKIGRAINPATLEDTIKYISKKLEKIDLDNLKLSEAIVLRGKAGLNWRFDASRDIGDLDVAKNDEKGFRRIWKGEDSIHGVEDFWANFVKNIKTYNPSSYIISELTNMGYFSWKNPAEFNENYYLQGLGQDERTNNVERDFINNTGSTTISNYNEYFNHLSEFIGIEPEHGYDVSWLAGNLVELKKRVDAMINNYQPNAAILSHAFVDNHDKPRILHAMPLNMWLYLNEALEWLNDEQKKSIEELTGRDDIENMSSAAIAVGLAFKEEIQNNYSGEEERKLLESLRRLVNGQKDDSSKPNYRRADAFGHLPYEITINDMFKGAGIDDDEQMLDFRFNFLKKYINYETKLWEMMNAVVGVPTLFNGTEFFQTGYESPSKNIYVANRNQTMHELKDDKRFGKYYNKMQEIASIYQKPGLSAMRDGSPISGEVKEEADGLRIWPIYKYNDKDSKVITLITNNGVPNTNIKYADSKNEMHTYDSITLDFGGEVLEDKLPLKKLYVNPNGKYVDDGVNYTLEKIEENGSIKYKIKGANGKNIHLKEAVEIFYCPKTK